jgi:nucleoside 2-deoxyribosyltransferase
VNKFVYVAAPWLDREFAGSVAAKLEDKGYIITHKWWKYEGEGEHLESEEFLRNCAENDVYGVKAADVVLVINTIKSEGKAAEQGIAIALGKPIVCFTPGEKPTSNIFHHLPCYKHVKTLDEALEAVSGE